MELKLRHILVLDDETKKIPKWQRSILVAEDNTVFLAAALAGNETAISMAYGFDGGPAYIHRKHFFVPTHWLAKEYPALVELTKNAEKTASSAG